MKLPPLYIPGCPHRPTLKQWIGLSLPGVRELLYGGAAFGGKSDFLLMAALQYIDQPHYSAVIFRRTFPQLSGAEDGLLARALEWLGPLPEFEGIEMIHGMPVRWKYRGGGTLSFSHLQYDRDKYNHQGPSYQFIGWDELTQFLESQYLYLMSRQRRLKDSVIPLRIRASSNPGGEGHEWVKARFVDAAASAKRLFLPAKLTDNPHADSEEYADTLSELHPYEREQLLNGDWDVRPPGSRFRREWFKLDYDERPADRGLQWLRRWDLAGTEPNGSNDPDYTVGTLWARMPSGAFICADMQRFRGTPQTVETRLKQTAQLDGRETEIVIEQEPGSSGKFTVDYLVRQLAGWNVRGRPSTGDKVKRSDPYASQAEAGNVHLVRGHWNEAFLLEHEQFTGEGKMHDDIVDTGSGAISDLTMGHQEVMVR